VEAGLKEARLLGSSSLPALQQAWGNFIRDRPWDVFATCTFQDQVHPERANKLWNAWIHGVEHSRFRISKPQPIIWARATELQRRGVYHYHALLANVAGVPLFVAMRLWEQIGGGFARILPYDVHRGAAYYIAKGGEIDLSPCWFDEPRRVGQRR
jgi:hypothetical protein